MNIAGLQKMTLLDYPGRIACTVFLAGCSLRCPFCHNTSLVLPDRCPPPPLMSPEELLRFLQSRQGKLDGVCITGGEPTLHRDLPQLIGAIRDLGFPVKLDTNGTNPAMLRALLEDGLLDYVAMDIKNCPARYDETCGGVSVLPLVQESVRLLMESHVDYEFRTTVFSPAHGPEEMAAIGQWLRGAKRYFIQAFVDSGDLIGTGKPLSQDEMNALLQTVLPYLPTAQLRGI